MEVLQELVEKLNEICSDIKIDDSNIKQFISDLKEVKSAPLYIAFIGPFSSGKTSIINSLIERDLLPVGLDETTQTIVRLVITKEDREVIRIGNMEYPLEALKDIDFTEDQTVEINVVSQAWSPGTTFIDTPGIRSIFGLREILASEAFLKADVLFYTVPANQGLSKDDLSFFERKPSFAARTVIVMTKTDLLNNEKEVEQQLQYIRSIAMNVGIGDVIPVTIKDHQKIQRLKKFIQEELLARSQKLKLVSMSKRALTILPQLRALVEKSLNAASLNMNEIMEEIERAKSENRQILEAINKKVFELKRKIDLIIRNEAIEVRKALVDAARNTFSQVIEDRNYQPFYVVAREIVEKAILRIEEEIEKEINIFVEQNIGDSIDFGFSESSSLDYFKFFLDGLPGFLKIIKPVSVSLKKIFKYAGIILELLKSSGILDLLYKDKVLEELMIRANKIADDFRSALEEWAYHLYPELQKVAKEYFSEQLRNTEQAIKNAYMKAQEKQEEFNNWKNRLMKYKLWIEDEIVRLKKNMENHLIERNIRELGYDGK